MIIFPILSSSNQILNLRFNSPVKFEIVEMIGNRKSFSAHNSHTFNLARWYLSVFRLSNVLFPTIDFIQAMNSKLMKLITPDLFRNNTAKFKLPRSNQFRDDTNGSDNFVHVSEWFIRIIWDLTKKIARLARILERWVWIWSFRVRWKYPWNFRWNILGMSALRVRGRRRVWTSDVVLDVC